MRTPTRIPATVPARRAALVGVAVALFSLVTTPAGAATSSPSEQTTALRAQRTVILARIASLADEVERARVSVADAQRGRALTKAALDVVRDRFARHAVDAYLDGVAKTEVERVRGKAWATTVAATDARMLNELHAATDAADRQEARANDAIASAATARAQLDSARAALETTISDRVTYLRALGRAGMHARETAMGVGAPVRHVRALGSQAAVMSRYRFGPGGIPAGLVASGQSFAGRASWYGPGFDGHTTASGAIFDQEGWTVAHKTLPLGTILLVTYNGRSCVVLVNDRGPYVAGRVLDLSHGVARALGTVDVGVARVTAQVLAPG